MIKILTYTILMLTAASNNTISASDFHTDSLKSIKLTEKNAVQLSNLALKCIQKEYPNKLDHVMNSEDEVLSPSKLHPAFYGCFDWHSSVHGHWMLVRLLKMFPEIANKKQIRDALNQNLSQENIKVEVAYFDQANRKSFERTYGWAWLLKLAEELYDWNDEDGKSWRNNLKPLTEAIVLRYMDFLPKQNYPIRTGVHPNTAFGIAFALDYARKLENKNFEKLLIERSKEYYLSDSYYDSKWEPSGEDFFSPALMEAELMSRVLDMKEFSSWFDIFLPSIKSTSKNNLLTPAIVTDRTDPKLVHLDGLNLSRAWCMFQIATHLTINHPAKNNLLESA